MRQRPSKRRPAKRPVSRFQSEFSRSKTSKLTLVQRLRRGIILAAGLSVLAMAGYFLLFAHLQVVGAPQSISGKIKDNDNMVFIPTFDPAVLTRKIKADYPHKVAGVTLRHEWWNRRLLVEVEPRRAGLVLRTQGNDYAVDREGVVVGEAGADTEALPLLVDQSNLGTNVGKQALPQQLAEFTMELQKSDLDIRRLRIIDTTGEIYADLNAGYSVRFATGSPLKVQLKNLSRIQDIASEKDDTITEYVDLRIPYKAYYR